MLTTTARSKIISTAVRTPVLNPAQAILIPLQKRALFHSYPSTRNNETNAKAIDIYQDLLSVYSDQSLTTPLKQHILKGMFLTNEITDMSNPVFKRLNSIIRQDPNLFDEEKLELISSLNTDTALFISDGAHHAASAMAHPMEFADGIEDIPLLEFLNSDNFLRKTLTAATVGISLISLFTIASSI